MSFRMAEEKKPLSETQRPVHRYDPPTLRQLRECGLRPRPPTFDTFLPCLKMGHHPFHHIQLDLWAKVFDHLTFEETMQCRRVCKSWYAIAFMKSHIIVETVLSRRMIDMILSSCSRCEQCILKNQRTLQNSDLDTIIQNAPLLEHLEVSHCDSITSLTCTQSLPLCLSRLEFDSCAQLKVINVPAAASLRRIRLEGCDALSQEAIFKLCTLPMLEEFSCGGMSNLEELTVSSASLRVLHIFHIPALKNVHIDCPMLERLMMDGLPMWRDDMDHATKMFMPLKSLSIIDCHSLGPRISCVTRSIQTLVVARCPRITHIAVGSIDTATIDAVTISHCDALRDIVCISEPKKLIFDSIPDLFNPENSFFGNRTFWTHEMVVCGTLIRKLDVINTALDFPTLHTLRFMDCAFVSEDGNDTSTAGQGGEEEEGEETGTLSLDWTHLKNKIHTLTLSVKDLSALKMIAPNLQVLELVGCTSLTTLNISSQSLSKLIIQSCSDVEWGLAEFKIDTPSLQQLEINSTLITELATIDIQCSPTVIFSTDRRCLVDVDPLNHM
eukprot:TRINITY_DN2874_c0_g1_i3.p1 TRINITY_DN2874_c0_g1~~TRINITY_DN2874_c0_g1_i3.p1  ORF type:complete len:554 (-),score=116.13 TRINITY_DN2874_c0_g1_i3:595-2256(-)